MALSALSGRNKPKLPVFRRCVQSQVINPPKGVKIIKEAQKMARIPNKGRKGLDFKNLPSDIRQKIGEGFKKAHDGHRLTLSKMTGKLDGIIGVSSNPLINSFCEKMQNVDGSICQKCYSCRLLTTARKSAIPSWTANASVLVSGIIDEKDLPFIPPDSFVRFNPHGELQNDVMLLNFCKIAELNPKSNFLLFTKRFDLIRRFKGKIPLNMSVIASAYYIDKPMEKIPEGFNGVFNVVTEGFADEHKITVNCPLKCKDCLKCWQKGKKTVIYERLK